MESSAPLQLRPLGIGQLLDQAIRLYRRNFLKFVGIVAIVYIPISLAQLVASLLTNSSVFVANNNDPVMTGLALVGLSGTILVAILNLILVQGVGTAALTRAIADNYLGRETSVLDAYRRLGNRWLSLVGALLLAVVIAIGLFIWFLVPCVGWFTGLGMLVFFSAIIIPLAAPVVVLEGKSAGQALTRAWNLARRRFWPVVGFILVLTLFGQIIVAGPSLLISLVFTIVAGEPLAANPDNFILQTAVQTLISLFLGLLYLPLQLSAVTLMYFDLRTRTEGFDLAMIAAKTGGEAVEMETVLEQAPQTREQSLITGTELANFAVLTVGGGVLLFGLSLLFGVLVAALGAALYGV